MPWLDFPDSTLGLARVFSVANPSRDVAGLSLFKLLRDPYSLFSFYVVRPASIQMGRNIKLEQALMEVYCA